MKVNLPKMIMCSQQLDIMSMNLDMNMLQYEGPLFIQMVMEVYNTLMCDMDRFINKLSS